ncbi:MAG TPA: methyltransferase domain-containing protein [Alphaproteobacteria bacterium]|nr:methyltransferase domain-containing protein [Alphaproteobacteria bacterium]
MRNATPEDKARRDKELFDRIATAYASKDLYGPSRIAREVRLLQTLTKATPRADLDLLEIGCGAGFAAEYLYGRYRTYTGIDYSTELIQYARNRNKHSHASFHPVDLFEFRAESNYDLIFMIGVLHHMIDISLAIKTCYSFIRPGGYLVVNEPQPANTIFSWLRAIRAKIDASYSDEQEELTNLELQELFLHAGFISIKSFPQGLFSTPFAEVMIPPQFLAKPLSMAACQIDRGLEQALPNFLKELSWNIIVVGEKAS